jgi:hypothetical protein
LEWKNEIGNSKSTDTKPPGESFVLWRLSLFCLSYKLKGTEEEVAKSSLKYIPYFRLKIIPILTLDQHMEILKNIK